MFCKRHYQAIAQAMQSSQPPAKDEAGNLTWKFIRNELIATFRADNPEFKADLFAQACEPGANVRARKVA